MSKSGGGGGDGKSTHYPPPRVPFHLLEVTLVSAQDLHRAAHHVRTYASVYIHRSHCECTSVDHVGRTDPYWNERFVFPVDDEFISSATSAVSVDIYHRGSFSSQKLLGTARLILSSLPPLADAPPRYAGVQIRRPKSLRPQGILNIGVALLNRSPYDDVSITVLLRKVGGVDRVAVLDSGSESWEVGEWEAGREWRAVQDKLKKWKEELSPEHGGDKPSNGGAKKRPKRANVGCFCRRKR